MARYKIIQCIQNIVELDAAINCQEQLDGVELNSLISPELLDRDWQPELTGYVDRLKTYPGIISAHGVCMDLNPASPDRKIFNLTKERYLNTIAVAKRLKAQYLVFHSQINPWLKDPKVKAIKNNRQLPFWEACFERVGENGPTLLLENVYEDNPRDLADLVQRIGHPRLQVCLDVGHVLANPGLQLDEWFEILADKIVYLHLHWNSRTYDQHQTPPDAFLAEIKELLEKYQLQPMIALEYAIPDLQTEITRVRKILG